MRFYTRRSTASLMAARSLGTAVALSMGDSRRESPMVLSPRRSPFISVSLVVVTCIVTVLPVAADAGASDDAVRVTAVANATLRAAPSPDAPAVAQLPLGTEVRDASPAGLDKTWALVRLPDAREGWLQTRLTKPIDPVWRTEAFDAIIAERLARTGDGFNVSAALVSLIDRVAPQYGDPASRATVALSRLRAVARAAAAIPAGGARREPYASWLAARGSDLIYDEPGGRWIMQSAAIWDVHAAHRDVPAADDIAWFAVTTGLAGECEGQVACYFSAQNQLAGAYLRAHPFGRRAADAVRAVDDLLAAVAREGRIHAPYSFDRTMDCQELTKAVDGLSAAIETSRGTTAATTVANLAAVRKMCR